MIYILLPLLPLQNPELIYYYYGLMTTNIYYNNLQNHVSVTFRKFVVHRLFTGFENIENYCSNNGIKYFKM